MRAGHRRERARFAGAHSCSPEADERGGTLSCSAGGAGHGRQAEPGRGGGLGEAGRGTPGPSRRSRARRPSRRRLLGWRGPPGGPEGRGRPGLPRPRPLRRGGRPGGTARRREMWPRPVGLPGAGGEGQVGGRWGSGPGAAPLHQRVRHGRGPYPPRRHRAGGAGGGGGGGGGCCGHPAGWLSRDGSTAEKNPWKRWGTAGAGTPNGRVCWGWCRAWRVLDLPGRPPSGLGTRR